MRIAVYPGSFNPLHIGHQAVMEYLTRDMMFDWVYLIVSPQNPFKDASNVLSAPDRYHAAVDAVKRHPELHVWVDDIEMHMDPPHYTIRTLDALRQREPENEFVLVMGADNLSCFRQWKDYRRILREYGIVVYPREGFDAGHLLKDLTDECPDYRIQVLKEHMVNISSTQIRQARDRGEDMSKFLM